MRNIQAIVFIIILSCINFNCSTGVESIPDLNLLSNGSFEINGHPSLAGWNIYWYDSSAVIFSNDVPPGGGSHSVRLVNRWVSSGWIQTTIAALPDTHIYRLSAYGKISPGYYPSYGWISLAMHKADTVLNELNLYFEDTSWVFESIIDTLKGFPGDSIEIHIRGDYHQMAAGYFFVDRVSLELLK
jgi:hypothetical protein